MEKKKLLHGSEIIELTSEEAFFKYKSALYDYCKKYNNLNTDLEERFQIASLGFVKAFNSYNNLKVPFISYLQLVVNNQFLMEFRKKKSYDRFNTISIQNTVQHLKNDDLTIEDTLKDNATDIEDDELKVSLEKIFSKMREKDIYIINRRLQGATQNEIAKELNMSRSNVCIRIEKFQKELIKRGVVILWKSL